MFWSDSFAIGIPEIDDEHQEFMGLCESLEAAVGLGMVGDVATLARRIADHSILHFTNEEQQLRASGYAASHAAVFRAHCDEHQRLTIAVAEACAKILEQPDAAVGVALEIKAALLEHLLRWDLRYKEFMVRAQVR